MFMTSRLQSLRSRLWSVKPSRTLSRRSSRGRFTETSVAVQNQELEDRTLLSAVQAGFDLYHVDSNTGANFFDLDPLNIAGIPAGTFLTLQGRPLFATSGLGQTDMIIRRLDTVDP